MMGLDDRDEEAAFEKLTNRVGRPFPFPSLALRIFTGVAKVWPQIATNRALRTCPKGGHQA